MKILTGIITLIALVFVALSVFAQDEHNEPVPGAGNGISNPDTFQYDTSNWCDPGGIWGPEMCADDYLAPSSWKWEYGWWWQRVIERDISPSMVPEPYRSPVSTSSNGNTVEVVIQSPSGPITIVVVMYGAASGNASGNAPVNRDVEIKGTNTFDARTYNGGANINDNFIIYGNAEKNTIYGANGNDIIYGEEDRDNLYGNGGDDTLYAGSGNYDNLYGGEGNDTLYGGDGINRLSGGEGADTLNGGGGNDTLWANDNAGNDDGAADTLDGGAGTDTCISDGTASTSGC